MGELISGGHGHGHGDVDGQHPLQNPEQKTGISRLSKFRKDIQTLGRDVLLYGTLTAAIPLVLLTALSERQRKSVRDDRDSGKCQFPARHNCTPGRLEVHHVSPQGKEKDMCIPEAVRDRPENVITICYQAHQVIVHPDMEDARREYRNGNKHAFNDVFEKRRELIARGEPYWNTVYDAAMLQRAKELTARATARGWVMPDVKRRERGMGMAA